MKTYELNHGVFSKNGISNIFFEPDSDPEALIIRLHGLPGRSPIDETNLLGKILTDVGIAFFAFDFPGIRESKGFYTYRHSFNVAKEILDYFAIDHDYIFPKIGLYAESFGGSIAVCLANASSIVSSLFLWSPVINFEVLSQEIKIELIIKFMEDSGVVRLPHYDDFSAAFSTQMKINPPEESQTVFEKLPSKILTSPSDILFSPSLITKELDPKYHHILQKKSNLDHNLTRGDSAIIVSKIARDYFMKTLM